MHGYFHAWAFACVDDNTIGVSYIYIYIYIYIYRSRDKLSKNDKEELSQAFKMVPCVVLDAPISIPHWY